MPYRKSRIVYGFKLKEGAVKLKVELQQKDEQAEGSSEEGRNGGKEDITDEQFVGMMLNFFGEMEQRKAALGRAPATPARNPSNGRRFRGGPTPATTASAIATTLCCGAGLWRATV